MATVSELQASQQTYAASWVNDAEAFLANVGDLAQPDVTNDYINAVTEPLGRVGLGYGTTDYTDNVLSDILARKPERPEFAAMDDIAAPVAPEITLPDVPDLSPLPDFEQVAPEVTIPDAPVVNLPNMPAAPALRDDLAIPDAPTFDLPTPPEFSALAVPEVPYIELPTFDGKAALPTAEILEPTERFAFSEAAYQSELLSATQAKLLGDLINGGYGIDEADEAALWQRERDRELAASNTASAEIADGFAARGFKMPPGAMAAAFVRATLEAQAKLSSVNREIALRRSDLFVQNRRATIQDSMQIEQILIGYYSSMMERALNASRAIAEIGISLFEARVRRHNAMLDAYKTEAEVFATHIRAAEAKLAVVRTQIEAVQATAAVRREQIDAYRAQVDGVRSLVDVYRARLDAASTLAQLERHKVDVFRSLVDGYAAQIGAKKAEFDMFASRVDAEKAKVQIFGASVDAYSSRVAAERTKAQALIERIGAYNEQANVKVSAFRAAVDAFSARLNHEATKSRAQTDVYRADIDAFNGISNSIVSSYRLVLDDAKMDQEWTMGVYNANLKKAGMYLEAFDKSVSVRLGAASYGSDFYKQAVSSAISSLSGLTAQIA